MGEFDFRHARFSENYKQTLERLNELHVEVSRFCGETGHTADIIWFSLEKCNIAESKGNFGNISGAYRRFFQSGKDGIAPGYL